MQDYSDASVVVSARSEAVESLALIQFKISIYTNDVLNAWSNIGEKIIMQTTYFFLRRETSFKLRAILVPFPSKTLAKQL